MASSVQRDRVHPERAEAATMSIRTKSPVDPRFGAVMVCPECDCEYTHLEHSSSGTGEDHRLNATLLFSCEDGHEFTIRFFQRKGNTHLQIENFA